MTIKFKTISALQEIRTASNLNFSRFTQLMQEAVLHFVEARLSADDAFSVLEQTLQEREPPVNLGDRRDNARLMNLFSEEGNA